MSELRLVKLKNDIIYGPVSSRRLGRSLGINLLGASRKVYTFDCVYCQLRQPRTHPVDSEAGTAACTNQCWRCGYAQSTWEVDPAGHELPKVFDVLAAVEAAIVACPGVQSLTLSGNGEPTLHPQFSEVVDGLVDLRDRLSPDIPVSVLSNASSAGRPAVRQALRRLDVRIMKIDAGDDETFRRLNRPCPGVTLAGVVEGLRALGTFTVQTMFVSGPDGNASAEQVKAWLGVVARLRPERLQVYSLDRVPATESLVKVSRARLEAIADQAANACGGEAHVY